MCDVRCVRFALVLGAKNSGILQNEGRTCNKFVGQISDVLSGLEKLHEKARGYAAWRQESMAHSTMIELKVKSFTRGAVVVVRISPKN